MPVIKIRVGNYKYPVEVIPNKGRLYLKFSYNKSLIEEIKCMEGAKWHGFEEPPRKIWSIADSFRNNFQIRFLMGENPYAHYDKPLVDVVITPRLNRFTNHTVTPYKHQIEMVRHGLTRRFCIFACEMGTGKTLAAIYIMEQSGFKDWWWIGTRSSLNAVQYEFMKWGAGVVPMTFTYEGLREIIEHWPAGKSAPRGVIFDESSKIKTPTAKRSQAALHLADAIRKEHEDGFAILMSGSPAPKAPTDWWHQCEVACPGFLKEGHIIAFKKRLGLIVDKESISGGVYPHLVTWRDNPDKCQECGQLRDALIHDANSLESNFHDFKASKNEVAFLYERMKGLVLVQLKKDCLDLPEKQYRIIKVTPPDSMLRGAKLIAAKATRAIEGLTLLRELSDGFQYTEEKTGETERCRACDHGKIQVQYCAEEIFDPNRHQPTDISHTKEDCCPACSGTGFIQMFKRKTIQVPTPKEDTLKDLLEEFLEIGRVVIYAGFTGSVDRCVQICQSMEWMVWRVDGRGWFLFDEKGTQIQMADLEYQKVFDDKNYDRVAFVGQPGAGGMGLTLTASPVIIYYSNDFNGESRIQSEDRIHRPGMDMNRGATIIDIFNLPSDEYVYNNLKRKRELQSLSLGELKGVFE